MTARYKAYSKVSPGREGGWGGLGLPRVLAVASNTASSSACLASISVICCSSFRRCSSCFWWAPRKARTRVLEGVRVLSQETAPHPTQDRGYIFPDLVFLGSQQHSAGADTHQAPKKVWDETPYRREAESQGCSCGHQGRYRAGGPTCEPYINHCSAQHSEHVWLAPSEPPVPTPPAETAAAPAGPGPWCRCGERRAHSHSQSYLPSIHPPAHSVSMGTYLHMDAHPA